MVGGRIGVPVPFPHTVLDFFKGVAAPFMAGITAKRLPFAVMLQPQLSLTISVIVVSPVCEKVFCPCGPRSCSVRQKNPMFILIITFVCAITNTKNKQKRLKNKPAEVDRGAL
jgi:hypothetical protein